MHRLWSVGFGWPRTHSLSLAICSLVSLFRPVDLSVRQINALGSVSPAFASSSSINATIRGHSCNRLSEFAFYLLFVHLLRCYATCTASVSPLLPFNPLLGVCNRSVMRAFLGEYDLSFDVSCASSSFMLSASLSLDFERAEFCLSEPFLPIIFLILRCPLRVV